MTTNDLPQPLGLHPRGRSAGRRNANCRPAAEGGDGLGNGGVTPPRFTPVYKRIDAEPNRPISARHVFSDLARALLVRGVISVNEHALYGVLLDRSNRTARSVHIPIRRLGEILNWSDSTVKTARNGLENIGLLDHHNRLRVDVEGARITSNRYGFCWNHELLDLIGWKEHYALRHLGTTTAHLHPAERRRIAAEARQRAERHGKVQAQLGRIRDEIDDLVTRYDDYVTLEQIVRDTWEHDPELAAYALDTLAGAWKIRQATIFGRQLAGLDISALSRRQRIAERYHNDADLERHALAALELYEPG